MSHLLSIVIVNYRSGQLTLDCLDSVYRHIPANLELIVVDNFSQDNSEELIRKRFPEVRWIQMGYNAGFARGNNAGISVATGDTILLLNPDTLAIDDSIWQCYQRLNDSGFAAAGVQLLDATRDLQISGSFFVKGGLNHLLPIPYWGDFIRWLGYKSKTKVPGVQQANTVQMVDWISGAFLMVKKETIKHAGLLDEDFFLYAEEVEWCSRLKKCGELAIFGDLKIIHLEGATINKSQNLEEKGYYNLYGKKGLQLMVSNHLRVRKQYGVAWFFILLLNYSFGWFVFGICGTLHSLFTLQNPLPLWKRVGAFGKNLLTLWRLTPTIVRNKPHFYKMF